MPIYFRSKQVKDLNFLKHGGKSYTRTGKHVPKGSTVTTPLSDCEPFYVTSCSATDFGNQIVIPGGTVTVPYSATEFQLKFTGQNDGDSGFLILEDSVGRTCTVQLSVNSLSALVFDVQETGVPSPHTFAKTSYPSTINYVDCMSHKWDITYAAQGSYYVTLYYKGTSIFKCGQAEIDLDAIYKVGSDNRTGIGGQINANIEQSSSVGYSLQYKTLNYGVDTANGATGMPVILQDLVDLGEDVMIYMKGTNGTGPEWETATGENLNTHEWGLSTTAGNFSSGNNWEKLTFPTGTYSTSATIVHGNSARICFAGTTPTTPGTSGDKQFTILKELIDIKSVAVGSTTPVTVEHDGETFIKFEGVNNNDTATVKFTSPVGMTCDVELKVDASGNLVFDTQSTGSGPLTYTSFPQTQQYTDCHGDQYDVTFTGLGSFHVTVGNMIPFNKTNTGIAKIDNRTDAAWYNYNIVGATGGKYNLAKENWSSIKTPTTYQPVAQVIEDNPDIVMTIGDGLTFTSPNPSLHSVVDAHPMWIKTVQSPGQPGPGETPDGVIINNGIAPQWVNYRFIRFRPTTPGTYYYNCEHHASMTGKIIVNDVSVSPILPTPTPTPTDATVSPPGGSTALEDNLTGIDKWWVVGARGTPTTQLTQTFNQSMSGRYVSGGGFGVAEFNAAVTAGAWPTGMSVNAAIFVSDDHYGHLQVGSTRGGDIDPLPLVDSDLSMNVYMSSQVYQFHNYGGTNGNAMRSDGTGGVDTTYNIINSLSGCEGVMYTPYVASGIPPARFTYVFTGVTELPQTIQTYMGNNINVTHRIDFKLMAEPTLATDNYNSIPPTITNWYPENMCLPGGSGPHTYEYEFTHFQLPSNTSTDWWNSTVLSSPSHRTGRRVSAGINHWVQSTNDIYSKNSVICIHKDDTIRIKNSAGALHPMEMKLINSKPAVEDGLDLAGWEALWDNSSMPVASFSNDTDFTTIPSQDANRFGDVVNNWHQLGNDRGWIYMIRCENHHEMAWLLEIKKDKGKHCPGVYKQPTDANWVEETPALVPTPTPTPTPTYWNPYPFWTATPTISFSGNLSLSSVAISSNWGPSLMGPNIGPQTDELSNPGVVGTGRTVNLQPGKVYTIINNNTNTGDTLRFTTSPGIYNDPSTDILILDAKGHPNPFHGGNVGTIDVDAVIASHSTPNISIDGEWYYEHGGYANGDDLNGPVNLMTIEPHHQHWPSQGNQF